MKSKIPQDIELRYALLFHHEIPNKDNHYDLMLEVQKGESLEELALLKVESPVSLDDGFSGEFCGTVRRRYLTFEGEMSHSELGEYRGRITQISNGIYVRQNTILNLKEGYQLILNENALIALDKLNL